ncbi:unnamed protein product, partial [marine sediment metagenome]
MLELPPRPFPTGKPAGIFFCLTVAPTWTILFTGLAFTGLGLA